MAKNEVAVKKEGGALALANEFESVSSGFEGMGQEDFALPFLRLLTNTSPEVGEVDGAMPGMVFNTVTGELYDGKKGLTVIPCAYVRHEEKDSKCMGFLQSGRSFQEGERN